MKFFHTADWHLGKLVQGVYMTEDQHFILQQFIQAIEEEKPDAIVIAGDLYDRAVPPTEAVQLLDDVLEKIILQLNIPVLAIGGNHDSPSRLNFASKIMQNRGLHIVSQLDKALTPIILHDQYGEVHFHLIPYSDPSIVRNVFQDEDVRSHQDAAEKIVDEITNHMDSSARHVYVGHAFVTPYGKGAENTSDSERPLSIGGAEYVTAELFTPFHYTALGHLHQAHKVMHDHIRYAGSPLKYSISEEHHKKGYYIVEMDETGQVNIEKRNLIPRRDMRTVEAHMEELLNHPVNEDYVFVRLLDEAPVLSPMEKIRSVYPNAMHVERKNYAQLITVPDKQSDVARDKMSDMDLFHAFYKEVKGVTATEETEAIFKEVLEEQLKANNEVNEGRKPVTEVTSS